MLIFTKFKSSRAKGFQLSLIKWISSGDLSMMAIDKDIVYLKVAMRVKF